MVTSHEGIQEEIIINKTLAPPSNNNKTIPSVAASTEVMQRPAAAAVSTNTILLRPASPPARLSQPCHGIWDKQIPRARVVGNDTLQQFGVYFSNNYGNVLSPYWAARTLAERAGLRFQGSPFDKNTFMQYLPTQADPPARPKKEALQRFLCHCPRRLEYFHEFPMGWSSIYQNYSQRHENGLASRCVIVEHGLHGFATMSAYNVLPTTGNFTVYTMSGRREGVEQICDELHVWRDKYIRGRSLDITIRHLNQSSKLGIDFSRLAFAPNLLIPSAGTSWALWSGLANSGRVVTVPFLKDEDPSVQYPSNFHVLRNVIVLYAPSSDAKSAKLLGFDNGTFAESDEGKKLLFDCYRNC